MEEISNSGTGFGNWQLPFLFVGDHLTMDLLNTIYRTADGTLADSLNSDSDVFRWLGQAGWPVDAADAAAWDGSLVKAAKLLRGAIRTIVETHRAGQPVPPGMLAPLNGFLKHARSHLELKAGEDGSLQLDRSWTRKTAEELLAPVAESAARLITSSEFALVKHCEDAQCVLWFLDRTKSHHRRWCSMAVCGNRNKVAAYRLRKQREA